MPFRGFEGPAGTGKLHQLIDAVTAHCAVQQLEPHQKILALTFMHGSRRRLDERLRTVPALRGRSVALTIDSFARTVWQRWRSLAVSRNLRLGDFDQTCDACGQLLEHPPAADSVARSFPILVVDEAQELSTPRLQIIRALAERIALFVAADEFQCLNEDLDTAPFMEWFGPDILSRSLMFIGRRGAVSSAQESPLDARKLQWPAPASLLATSSPTTCPSSSGPPLYRAGSKAVLYAPGGNGWARAVVDRLAHGLRSARYDIPPLTLVHEVRPGDEVERVTRLFAEGGALENTGIHQRLDGLAEPPRWLSQVRAALKSGERCHGRSRWTADELTAPSSENRRTTVPMRARVAAGSGYVHPPSQEPAVRARRASMAARSSRDGQPQSAAPLQWRHTRATQLPGLRQDRG